MAWIKIVDPEAATGLLKSVYDEAIERAGKVYNVLRIQSVRPEVLDASVRLYLSVMHSPQSALTRAQREMIATAVSRANQCVYWTLSHGEDLRAEVQAESSGEALARHVMTNYREASLSDADRTMLDFAIKLTRTGYCVTEQDMMRLREVGFDDVGIHDIVQVTALFNYYNRLVDGLGIDPE